MTKEEKKALEDAATAARAAADQAHQAAADTPGDEALQEAAEKAEDAAADAQAAADAATVDQEPPKPKEGDEEDDEEVIDFEKELEALEQGASPAKPKSELEKAEKSLFFTAQRVKELGGDPSKVITPPPADPTPPAPKVPAEGEFVTTNDFVEAEFGKIAKTEAERKVLMHHYKHSIQKTGNLATDMENAYFIANKGKIQRSFAEIRRSGFSRPLPGGGPGRRPAPKATTVVQLTADEIATMTRRGYKQRSDGAWESKRYVMEFVTGKGWKTTRKS